MDAAEHDQDDIPTGLPDEEEAAEPSPLGAPDEQPAPASGEEAMPGIVTGGDPPDAG